MTLSDQEIKENIIKKIKNYEWGKLWNDVSHIQINSLLPNNQKYLLLSVKAMLLGALWQDHQSTKEILKNIKIEIDEQIIFFLLSYSYLSVGDYDNCLKFFSKLDSSKNAWMTEWLDLEYQGRSKQYIQQIKKLESIFKTKKKIDNTHKIALLQSLDHKDAEVKPLKELFIKQKLNKSDNPFDLALSIRLGLVNKNKIVELYSKDTIQPFLLYRVTHSLISNLEIDSFIKAFDKLVETKFINIFTLMVGLMIVMSFSEKEVILKLIKRSREISPDTLYVQGTLTSFELIQYWIENDIKNAVAIYNKYRNYLLQQSNFTELSKAGFIFYSYIGFLIAYREKNIIYYEKKDSNYKDLYIFGESHSLAQNNIIYLLDNNLFLCKSLFIMGCKMHHIAKPDSSYMSLSIKNYLNTIEDNSNIMFTIGEIDTRPDEGIWQLHLKKQKDLDEIILDTVGGYLNFLYENLKDINLSSVTIQGIPAPNYELKDDKDPKDEIGFLNMIKKVNEKLKELTLQKAWNFLDVYGATVGEDLKSNKKWHIDGYHLSPVFYPSEANKWLIKPKIN